jgi:uncharacterized SAM-binding protein YcdF (DUF218 family)
MFALKQFVGAWLMPLPVAVLLLIAAVLCRALTWRRTATTLWVTAVCVAALSTLGCVGNGVLWLLEARYAAVTDVSRIPQSLEYVVVLGSGYRPRDGIPVTAALDATAVVRIAEGVRLFRQLPDASLILSGGSVGDHPPSAEGYRTLAAAWGVPLQSIVLMDDVVDTAAEIRSLRDRVGDSTVLLVTSASHMPRALEYCSRYGVRALAAPTGHLAEPPSTWGLRGWLLPSGVHLRKTETALHEYVGLLAMRLGLT